MVGLPCVRKYTAAFALELEIQHPDDLLLQRAIAEIKFSLQQVKDIVTREKETSKNKRTRSAVEPDVHALEYEPAKKQKQNQ